MFTLAQGCTNARYGAGPLFCQKAFFTQVSLHFLLQHQDGDSSPCRPFLVILLNSTDTFINNPYSKSFSINSMIVATISCQDPDRYKV